MLPFGFTIITFVELFKYHVEIDISLTYWDLHFKRNPDKGLVLLAKVGPVGLYIYDLKKQEEWFNRIVRDDDIGKEENEQ
jgi:hypothetical protein